MSIKTSHTKDIFSLPKGGGAIKGIGETFSADLFSGTGNFTAPLSLFPGRNNFQPTLNLVYSTGQGNGIFGLGWNLSIPGITRKTAKSIPKYQDDCDVFILSGSEDLLPVSQEQTADDHTTTLCTKYRPRTEGLFAKIEHYVIINQQEHWKNDYWKVSSKDGLVSCYGTPRPAAAPENWQDQAVIRDPEDHAKIFNWKLSLTLDIFGNRIEYHYDRDAGDNQRSSDQLYLKKIQYNDYVSGVGLKFLHQVHFNYSPRPDTFSSYRSGFEIRTSRRCSSIELHVNPGQDMLSKSFLFTYADQMNSTDMPLNGMSLLKQIQIIGQAGEAVEPLPPLLFKYSDFNPEKRDLTRIHSRDSSLPSLSDPEVALLDIFGNGLPDILETKGSIRYWRNIGNGNFDLPREMKEAPGGFKLSDPGISIIDANGNGRPDVMVSKPGQSGYFPMRFKGFWDKNSFHAYKQAPSFALNDPDVKMIDLDGDGITDAMRAGEKLECFFNHPEKGWHETRFIERKNLDAFPDISFSDPRIVFADMSGDGLQDIVLIHDGNINYWPNLGYGNWGKRVVMSQCPRFPYEYNPKRVLIGDVDGDGLADIVYVDDTKVTLWLNRSGHSFSDPMVINGTPPVTDIDNVTLADIYGSGITGILWSRPNQESGMFFLDFCGKQKPYLLNEMDNCLGALTRTAYESSVEHYLKDRQNPETRWKTPLPFPVLILSKSEVVDTISRSKKVSTYSYHHGYWDGQEQEFRGFGRVDQQDTEIFEEYHKPVLHNPDAFENIEQEYFAPPLLSRSWFHQGPIGDEEGGWYENNLEHEYWQDDLQLLQKFSNRFSLIQYLDSQDKRDALRVLRGQRIRSEIYAMDRSSLEARPYTVTETCINIREETAAEHPVLGSKRIFLPYTFCSRTAQWERGDDPMLNLSFTDDLDEYGQPGQNTSIALPRRQAKRVEISGKNHGSIQPNESRILATHSRTAYIHPEIPYIQDRVSQVHQLTLSNPPTVSESDPENIRQVLREHVLAAKEVHALFSDFIPGQPLPASLELIGHTINHYDGRAFEGLPPGQIGDYGVLIRSEALIATADIFNNAYGDRRPVYLDGSAQLPEGMPRDFQAQHGYYKKEGGAEDYGTGYYACPSMSKYDFQEQDIDSPRGLLLQSRDTFNNYTSISYDDFKTMPVKVIDPIGLQSLAEYDYRMMQPSSIQDPNGNTIHFVFSALGLMIKQYLSGQKAEGGTQDKPELSFTYDLFAYQNTRDSREAIPSWVHSTKRVYHAKDNLLDEVIEARQYSDGFGRLIQSRAPADEIIYGESGDDVGLPLDPELEPTPAQGAGNNNRVIVNGWTIYDNKGQPIKKYEPFFSQGWDFQRKEDALKGMHSTLYYDPRGEIIRTVNPDNSEQREIYGIPETLDSIDSFSPTSWEKYTYDSNDLAVLTRLADHQQNLNPDKPLPAYAPLDHHYTPGSVLIDGLGRTLCSLARRGLNPDTDFLITRSRYDIRGNVIEVFDTQNRPAFQQAYDLANQPLRITSLDAGIKTTVFSALGKAIESRDSKGSIIMQEYDALMRPTHKWARDLNHDPMTCRELIIYGDDETGSGLNRETAGSQYLLGRVFKFYDDAGLQDFSEYDFKGNLLEKSRRTISDQAIADNWSANWIIPDTDQALETQSYQTSTKYDALNRPLTVIYPEDVNGSRAKLVPEYNQAGSLNQVFINHELYVKRIAYSAKGQRVLIAYGNGIMTRYAYDPRSFHLVRMRSEHYSKLSTPENWMGQGPVLQDSIYNYDLTGNITGIDDRASDCGVPGSINGKDHLLRQFEYDPFYQLSQAGGREYDKNPDSLPWQNQITPQDPGQTRLYTQQYTYDDAGNMQTLKHIAGAGSFTRELSVLSNSNKMDKLIISDNAYSYSYDANGNLIKEHSNRHFEWDYADRLKIFQDKPAGSREPSMTAGYLYGSDGTRIKKWVKRQGHQPAESTVYIDGMFEHSKWEGAKENNHLHVMDDSTRIAIIRKGPAFDNDNTPDIQYQLNDHLGSSNLVIGADGIWTNREEFTPFGETGYGSFSKKRYRFTGQERDEESGLNYHAARYYAPWLCRWISCDPKGAIDSIDLYQYSRNNPLTFMDTSGLESDEAKLNLVTGPYSEEAGHHLRQSGAHTDKPVGKGGKDALHGQVTCISQKKGDFSKKMHADVSRGQNAVDQAAWSSSTKSRKNVNKTAGNLTVRSSGSGSLAPRPTTWYEDLKTLYSLQAGDVPTNQAYELTDFASNERAAEGSYPKRVPRAPQSVPDSIKLGQITKEVPLKDVLRNLPESAPKLRHKIFAGVKVVGRGAGIVGGVASLGQDTPAGTNSMPDHIMVDPHWGEGMAKEEDYFIKLLLFKLGISDKYPRKPEHLLGLNEKHGVMKIGGREHEVLFFNINQPPIDWDKINDPCKYSHCLKQGR
ncbi:VCBS repeat-containing protein [bacterium]|nr:VCBS repeat-containing protein [bacterium]